MPASLSSTALNVFAYCENVLVQIINSHFAAALRLCIW